MKPNISWNFQICISVPLSKSGKCVKKFFDNWSKNANESYLQSPAQYIDTDLQSFN